MRHATEWTIALLLLVIALAVVATLSFEKRCDELSVEVTRLTTKLSERPTPDQVDKQCAQWLMNSDLLKARDRVCAGVVQRLIKKGK